MLINASRATPLIESPQLDRMAQTRAVYFCNHKFEHGDWHKQFENTHWSWIGENLAKGFSSAAETEAAFMASPEHKANIVKPEYTHVGLGYACGVTVELFGHMVK